MSKDALEAIAQAAVTLAAERNRLNKAFDGLRTTVQVLDPSAMLQDDGTIQFEGGAAIKVAPEPPVTAPPPPAAVPEPPPPAPPEPEPEPPARVPEPKPAAKPAALSQGEVEGLARSPKPRSKMRSHEVLREERLDGVVAMVRDQPNQRANPVDLSEDMGVDKAKMQSDFRELEARGVFRIVGRVYSRFAMTLPAKGRGRKVGVYQYVHVGNGPSTATKPKPEKKVVTDEDIRDAGNHLGEFNMHELMEELHADESHRGQIVRCLENFVNRGTYQRTLKGWKHVKPIDPGAAASYDTGAARGSGTRQDISPSRGGSGAVPGTGKPKQSGNKDVNEMLAAARRQWPGSVEQSGDSHWKIKLPPGSELPFLRIANSPGSAKSLNGDKAKLRKAGLQGI